MVSEPSTDFEQISYEVRGPVAVITLDRPDQLNAFTPRMAAELIEAFDRSDADDSVRGVVVTGAGRAFCAGADLSTGGRTFDLSAVAERPSGSDGGPSRWGTVGEGDHEAPADLGGVVVLRIHRSLKPVIAAVNGPAVGVGLTMTLPMDVRLVVEGAKLGFVFNRRGISIDGAASWFLPRVVGISQALEWVSSGRIFGPQDALAAGLVRSVYPDRDAVVEAAVELVEEIAEHTPPVSTTVSRRLLWDAMASGGPEDAHRRESLALLRRGQSADAREGVTAFIEKRAARFPDRVSDSVEVSDPPR
jgi:enoyl-CoA hydratase/carnithine racemase